MTDLDLAWLRKVAEAATRRIEGKPVSWYFESDRWRVGIDWHRVGNLRVVPDAGRAIFHFDDAQHIATFDPPTVLALLDELEGFKDGYRNMGLIVDDLELDNAKLKAEVAKLNGEIAEYSARGICGLLGDNDELRREIAHLKDGLSATESMLRLETERAFKNGKERDEHCRDCCCARSWVALGDVKQNGQSIPLHIQDLREERDTLKAHVAEVEAELNAAVERALDWEAENVKLREKCETLEGYSTALEAEVEEHNSLLGLAETENEKLKTRVAELEEARSVLSNQRIPYSLGEGDD